MDCFTVAGRRRRLRTLFFKGWVLRGLGWGFIAATLVLCCVGSMATARALPRIAPDAMEMDALRLAAIDSIVAQGLHDKAMPGAVVLVARHGHTVYLRAFGERQVQPEPKPMTTDTVFDLASLTKPIATAACVMKLIEMKRVRLDDPVARHVPEFGRNDKQGVTVFQLLTHQGGLAADNAMMDYQSGSAVAWENICSLPLIAEPGTRFVYSDIGFLVLGELVRRVAGVGEQEFSRRHLFGPLGMSATGFLPSDALRQRAAPTEQRDGRWMMGEVHDPRAYALGGVAGHAGLFSTAEDLAVFGQMMLQRGEYGGVRVLESSSVDQMTHAYQVPGGLRGLGWDIRTGYSSNRGDVLSPRAFGHGGFTGTALWIDPELDLIVVFLSNRVHPYGKGSVNRLIGRLVTAAAAAIVAPAQPSEPKAAVPKLSEANAGVRVFKEGPYLFCLAWARSCVALSNSIKF